MQFWQVFERILRRAHQISDKFVDMGIAGLLSGCAYILFYNQKSLTRMSEVVRKQCSSYSTQVSIPCQAKQPHLFLLAKWIEGPKQCFQDPYSSTEIQNHLHVSPFRLFVSWPSRPRSARALPFLAHAPFGNSCLRSQGCMRLTCPTKDDGLWESKASLSLYSLTAVLCRLSRSQFGLWLRCTSMLQKRLKLWPTECCIISGTIQRH